MKLLDLCKKCSNANHCGTNAIVKLMDVASGEVADREPVGITCRDYVEKSEDTQAEPKAQRNTVICGFPGIGKSTAEMAGRIAVDMESTSYHFIFDETGKHDNPRWPGNYVDVIEEMARNGAESYILVSTHREVRDELTMRGIDYVIVMPQWNLKDEYLARYLYRGSPAHFISEMSDNWERDMKSLSDDGAPVIMLTSGMYLTDILPIGAFSWRHENDRGCPYGG